MGCPLTLSPGRPIIGLPSLPRRVSGVWRLSSGGQNRALCRGAPWGSPIGLALVFLCTITSTALHAADAPLTCRVLSQSEDGQVLILLSHANMLPGMELVPARDAERVLARLIWGHDCVV